MGKREANSIPKEYPDIKTVLGLLAGGLIIAAAIIAPPTARVGLQIAKELFPKDWGKFHESRLHRTFIRLKRRGLVDIVDTKDGQVVQINDAGKKLILKYDLEDMKLDKNKPWDRIWRVIIFDVPEGKKKNRDLFRKKLVDLGFVRIQKSVFVCPYRCEKEIAYLREIYEIGDNVLFLHAKRIEDDEKLKKLFKIK